MVYFMFVPFKGARRTYLHLAQYNLILAHQFHELVGVSATPLFDYLFQKYTALFEAEEGSSLMHSSFEV
jgi:hypothetical protein